MASFLPHATPSGWLHLERPLDRFAQHIVRNQALKVKRRVRRWRRRAMLLQVGLNGDALKAVPVGAQHDRL